MSDEDLFDLDDYIAENRRDPYRFKYGGRRFELPHFADIDWRTAETAEAAAGSADVTALRKIFQRAFGEDQWIEFESLPQPSGAMGELFRRWRKHAGTKPGESPGSADSSESTAEPSTRRSAPATGSRSVRRSRAK